ncbi:MAG: methylenetetrahydrofolate reductase [Xanthomonadales bacterium]|nr:methylenetetrahydrofolate reductase [Xanthomonadales bacterium]NIX14014.1 methylenetetrahydrofolate reductase [Xanthomonadales bacterium]
MIEVSNSSQRGAMIRALHDAYMEVFPTPTIESRLMALEPGSDVAITCSPTKGVEVTLRMTEHLSRKGFKVIPHIAARNVRDRVHLEEIMGRLDDARVRSMFIPGGDARSPEGEFATAFELLQAIAGYDHGFTDVGVAAHPEGHPDVDDEKLLEELEKKQPLATYLVTQMCFDAGALNRWLQMIRGRGINLPAWIGVPGVADRVALLKTSMRIGVGTSLKFLRNRSGFAGQFLFDNSYAPDGLLSGLVPLLDDAPSGVAGFHIYCFNKVEQTEKWRQEAMRVLRDEA